MQEPANRSTRGKRLAALVQWALIAVAVVSIGWIIAVNADELSGLLEVDARILALISLSALATFVLNGVELQVLANRFGNEIPFKDTLLLGLMVSTLNYLPMKTGTILNGVVMRARHGVRLTHFASLVTGSTLIHLWVASVGAGAVLASGSRPVLGWLLVAIPTALLAGLVVWGRLHEETDRSDRPRLTRLILTAIDGLRSIFGDARLMAIEIAINVALIGLAALRLLWSFEALSAPLSFGSAVVVTSLAIVAARLSVIPGGLGFREGGAAAGAAAIGISTTLGLAAAVIDRAVTLAWLLVLGVPATLYLQRQAGLSVASGLSVSLGGSAPEEGRP